MSSSNSSSSSVLPISSLRTTTLSDTPSGLGALGLSLDGTGTGADRGGSERSRAQLLQHHRIMMAMVNRKVEQIMRQQTSVRVNPNGNSTFKPRMDLVDDPAYPKVMAMFEIPGVRIEDVSLGVHSGFLVVEGTRQNLLDQMMRENCGVPNTTSTESASHSASSDRMDTDTDERHSLPPPRKVHELRYGRFERRVQLPTGVNQSDIAAILKEGMLTVTWPRPIVSLGTAAAATTTSGSTTNLGSFVAATPTASALRQTVSEPLIR